MRYLVNQLLEGSARRCPGNVAVIDGERQLTYAELDERANRLASVLAGLGVRRGDRIGIYLNKSLESIVAIYGILKAGACYVPFDPQAPAARLGYIAGNCGIRVLCTGAEKAGSWAELTAHGAPLEALVVLNGTDDDGVGGPPGVRVLSAVAIDAASPEQPAPGTISLDLAYILYTSGSTGMPKGVKLTHQNALGFVLWAVQEYGVGPDDKLSSHAPLHFDLSTFDLFAAAAAGACVVLVPGETSVFPVEVARFIERNEITVWYSVPSVLSMLTMRGKLQGGEFPALRVMLFAGEVFPTKYLRRLMELLPHVRFSNLYGPTETNVCTYYDVPPLDPDRNEPIPIGKAIAGVDCFAVTDDGRIAEPGEIGELYVRGPTVMQGYWGDPERTQRGLLPNPFGGELHDNVYRTGDLVQADPEGNYLFLGRRDAQIKSRGYRIELGDIEAALYAHPSVVECAATAVPDEMVTNRIKAYLVVRDEIGQAEIVRFLGERIPRYMIPDVFEFRPELPKTSTGKIDRQALAPAGSS